VYFQYFNIDVLHSLVIAAAYVQRRRLRKFITTYERIKSFKSTQVDMPLSRVWCAQVDPIDLGSRILASNRVTFLYLNDSRVYYRLCCASFLQNRILLF